MSKAQITVQLGEFSKTADFGMNFIKNLRDDIGKDLEEIGEEMVNGENIDRMYAMAELLFSAFKSFDRMSQIPVDYNVEKCFEWVMLLSDDQIGEFQEVMQYATTLHHSIKQMGKKKREESPQTEPSKG